jgi:hypothetical protein
MTLAYDLVQNLQHASPTDAWAAILEHAWSVCSPPLNDGKAEPEIARRDRAISDTDLYLATAAWDLWSHFETSVPRTSETLVQWWNDQSGGRAVLILDALSLRESPWLLVGAESRGYTIHVAKPTCAELPADTTPFAKALGFGQRSSLSNNGASGTHRLPGAHTESTDIAWRDCANLIGSQPNWVFWHHWPDHRLHEHDDPGKGLSSLTHEVEQHLTGDDFWALVDRLATGRRLVITADHGYAASGLFPDSDKDQTEYLKKVYKSGRWDSEGQDAGSWVPPIDLAIESKHGNHLFVNGRRKWKSAGGYPTLTHGGLSVLEVAVPFIELSKS